MRTDLIRATVLTAAGIAATAGGIAGPAIAAHAAPTTKPPPQAQTDRNGERELNVRYEAQPNFYYCGPAATRNALSVQGKTMTSTPWPRKWAPPKQAPTASTTSPRS